MKVALFGICCLLVMSCFDRTKMNKALSLTAAVNNPQIRSVPNSRSYQLRLPVSFTLSNGGDGSAMVIKDAMKIIRVSIAASEENLKSGKYVYDRQAYPSFKQKELENPDQQSAALIGPKQSFTWEVEWTIHVVEKDDRSSSSPELSLESLRNLQAAWLRFEVSFFPITMKEEGRKLQAAWKSRGELLIDSLTSEPVRLDLQRLVIQP